MSSILIKDKDVKNSKLYNTSVEQGTSYEVFRNNTTAVEVVVKDVKSRKKSVELDDVKLNRAQADVANLQFELNKAKMLLTKTRKSYQSIVREMRKQMESISLREADTQAENLALKFENEKLKILLASKTKLLSRSKKELFSLRRGLKSVLKSICNTPEVPRNFDVCSDVDYDEFESDLKSNTRLKSTKTPNRNDTLDSTFSVKDREKELKSLVADNMK